jgi:isoleucyl-tRNA synthetase
MDRWIISFTQSLLLFVKTEMAAYRLYTVLPRFVGFHFEYYQGLVL